MKMYAAGMTLLLAPLLAGCGNDAPAPTAAERKVLEARLVVPVMGEERRILALGDSLFTGYGLGQGEGYPERLETALRARGINARITNAGISGDTTAGGLQRLAFTLDSQGTMPDLVVISLGGNDMLRGLSPAETRRNLDAMLTEIDRRGGKAMLLGMLAPPNLGPEFRAQFDGIYPDLARQHGAALVPFFLQPVFGRPDLVQQDHIHPTKVGIGLMVEATAESVAKALPVSPAAPPNPR